MRAPCRPGWWPWLWSLRQAQERGFSLSCSVASIRKATVQGSHKISKVTSRYIRSSLGCCCGRRVYEYTCKTMCSANVYIYKSIHTYIHKYIHTYMHEYIHTYMHTYIWLYIYVCVRVHSCRYASVCRCVCSHVDVHIHQFVGHACSHAYTCAHAYAVRTTYADVHVVPKCASAYRCIHKCACK